MKQFVLEEDNVVPCSYIWKRHSQGTRWFCWAINTTGTWNVYPNRDNNKATGVTTKALKNNVSGRTFIELDEEEVFAILL